MKTVVRAVREGQEGELESIQARYDRLGAIYRPLVAERRETPLVAWCKARVKEGLPEWFIGSVVANLHLNAIGGSAGLARMRESHDNPIQLLTDPRYRELVKSEKLWSPAQEDLNRMLDMAAVAVLQSYGVEPRPGRGYAPGRFFNVLKRLGLLDLDVSHEPLFG